MKSLFPRAPCKWRVNGRLSGTIVHAPVRVFERRCERERGRTESESERERPAGRETERDSVCVCARAFSQSYLHVCVLGVRACARVRVGDSPGPPMTCLHTARMYGVYTPCKQAGACERMKKTG